MNRIKMLLASLVAAICVMAAMASFASADVTFGGQWTLQVFHPLTSGGQIYGGAYLSGNTGVYFAETETCIQIQAADGSFVNKSGSCIAVSPKSFGWTYSLRTSYSPGHVFRTWAWATVWVTPNGPAYSGSSVSNTITT